MTIIARCSGTSVDQKITQNIYINKLIITGSPENYQVDVIPSIFQKIKQAIGLYPKSKDIEKAVRLEILGESPTSSGEL